MNGLRIGTTCSTPSWPSRPRRATCSRSPIAPMTVTSSPRDGWARAPHDSMRAMTACTCSSVAVGFITIIMGLRFSWNTWDVGDCRWSGARPGGPSSGRRWLRRATPAERLAKSPDAIGERPERIRTPAGRDRGTAGVRGPDGHRAGLAHVVPADRRGRPPSPGIDSPGGHRRPHAPAGRPPPRGARPGAQVRRPGAARARPGDPRRATARCATRSIACARCSRTRWRPASPPTRSGSSTASSSTAPSPRRPCARSSTR